MILELFVFSWVLGAVACYELCKKPGDPLDFRIVLGTVLAVLWIPMVLWATWMTAYSYLTVKPKEDKAIKELKELQEDLIKIMKQVEDKKDD